MSSKVFAVLAALAAATPAAAEEPLWPEGLILFPPAPRPARPLPAAAARPAPPSRPASGPARLAAPAGARPISAQARPAGRPSLRPTEGRHAGASAPAGRPSFRPTEGRHAGASAPAGRPSFRPTEGRHAGASAPAGACGERALEEIETAARPGDILLARREADAAPGAWWRRAAVYVGVPEERAAWIGAEDLEAALNAEAADAYWTNLQRLPEGRPRIVLDGPGGVRLVPLRALGADAIALLRPRLPGAGRAALLRRAFAAVGRPAGALSARPGDDWARAFDLEFGRPEAHADLIRFFERRSPGSRATRSGIEEFRRTWRRPATAGAHKEE